jgi:molybdopterin/thiamine biosynthesis adenylyltransferase
MGFSEDIMHNFAMRDLRTVFPVSEGWQNSQITPVTPNSAKYTFSRRVRGTSENAIAIVSLDPKLTPAIADNLAKSCAAISHCTKQILLVPQSTNLQAVPSDFQVLTMSTFGFESGKLTWLTKKRFVKKYPSQIPNGA